MKPPHSLIQMMWWARGQGSSRKWLCSGILTTRPHTWGVTEPCVCACAHISLCNYDNSQLWPLTRPHGVFLHYVCIRVYVCRYTIKNTYLIFIWLKKLYHVYMLVFKYHNIINLYLFNFHVIKEAVSCVYECVNIS